MNIFIWEQHRLLKRFLAASSEDVDQVVGIESRMELEHYTVWINVNWADCVLLGVVLLILGTLLAVNTQSMQHRHKK